MISNALDTLIILENEKFDHFINLKTISIEKEQLIILPFYFFSEIESDKSLFTPKEIMKRYVKDINS